MFKPKAVAASRVAIAAAAALAVVAPTSALAGPERDVATTARGHAAAIPDQAADLRIAAQTSSLAGMTSPQDLRSPDTRDATRVAVTGQELRSPDARAAADDRSPVTGPEVVVVKAPSGPAASGIDWGDAGIGAGGLLLVGLVGLGGVRFVVRRGPATPGAPPLAGV